MIFGVDLRGFHFLRLPVPAEQPPAIRRIILGLSMPPLDASITIDIAASLALWVFIHQ
jgi:hypothetical protein